MTYECKIYDAKGKLKKIVHQKKFLNEMMGKILSQKSTAKSKEFINKFKEGKDPKIWAQKFYEKTCLVCQKEFYCRRPTGKYCSHECQKRQYYLRTKSKRGISPSTKQKGMGKRGTR